MKLSLKLNQHGFTLVELMLAMVLFSTILVISTVGFIGMNRTFNRGTIKKQLSESVQTTTEDMGRALRAQSNNSPSSFKSCSGGDDTTCTGYLKDWNTLKIGSSCYLWQSKGLYKSTGTCNLDNKQELLDSRYVVASGPSVDLVSDNGLLLYRVSGVFTTDQPDAIHSPGDGKTDVDTTWHCKGTAESSNVATCAVESFSIIINPQGSAL